MKISVNRVEHPDKLVFTIEVTDAHEVQFTADEKSVLDILEKSRLEAEKKLPPESKLYCDLAGVLHSLGEKTFTRLRKDLTGEISREVVSKVKPICQEIYNWISDKQSKHTRFWMASYDPQRTKYYFHNDPLCQGDGDFEEDDED